MAQIEVEAQKEMQKLAATGKKGGKRASAIPTTEPKRRKTKKTSTVTTPQEPAQTEYGRCNALQILTTADYVLLQKNKSTFRMYPRQLKVLGDQTMELSSAMQDGLPLTVDLSNNMAVAVERYQEAGFYVKLTNLLNSGYMWTMSLKFGEFSYLLENSDDLLSKFKFEDPLAKANKKDISARDLYDLAVRIFSNLVEDQIKRLKTAECNGCITGHPSQDQHDVCLQQDTPEMVKGYVTEAFPKITKDQFAEALEKATTETNLSVTPQMLWVMCRKAPLDARIKDVVMTPSILRQEVDLMVTESATAVADLTQ